MSYGPAKPRDKSCICSKRQMEDSVGKHHVPTGHPSVSFHERGATMKAGVLLISVLVSVTILQLLCNNDSNSEQG